MDIQIRDMMESDILDFHKAFKLQGWDKPIKLFEKYYKEQKNGVRKVFIAVKGEQVLGYATLLPNAQHGPFANQHIPTVCDFNVLEKYQRKRVGTAIFNAIEDGVKKYSDKICLGVGLHAGYGPAQRLYIKRGYIPDGSGVWYNNERLEPYAACTNNDDLVLYLSKDFTRKA
ncbi:MAG: N-acetyltransferase family protein [Zhenhengia sp.]|uniref:GNAT family N-acetyltransferase n=1 Tax=Zhenhengia sp. TaxID=2944208 RepID=UPI003992A9FA